MNKKDFLKSLECPLEYWATMKREEVEGLLGYDAGRMVGFQQDNPHHCYDLFFHTLHTVDGIQADTAELQPGVLELLKVAAFFHDLGKPEVVMRKGHRNVFYGHPLASVELCEPILRKLLFTDEEIKLICFWIRHHDDFIPYRTAETIKKQVNSQAIEINPKNITRYFNKTKKKLPKVNGISEREIWLGLFVLCYADASAQAEFVNVDGEVISSKKEKCDNYSQIKMCYLNYVSS